LPPQAKVPIRAYSPLARLAAGLLVALSGASLPAILVLVVVATDPPVTPPLLVRLLLVLAAVPAGLGWLIGRACAGDVEIQPGALLLRRRHLRIEVPPSAIAGVEPWRIPLPGPGLSLRMQSGRRLGLGIETRNPLPLLMALSEETGVPCARLAAAHAVVRWADAKAKIPLRRPHWLFAKFVAFALLPAAVLFNAHQHISYGGTFGQYYLEGPIAYLRTLAVYWGTTAIYLVLYAGVWRGLGEALALISAYAAPSSVTRVRRVVELACRTLYYAGVPVLLYLRFR
jgi:hypothetical protein